MTDCTLDACCAKEIERERKNAKIWRALKEADPIAKKEKQAEVIIKPKEEILLSTKNQENIPFQKDTAKSDSTDSSSEDDYDSLFSMDSEEERLWSQFRDLRMSKIVSEQKKVISDKESSQFILSNLRSQDLEPVVFIVGAEEDVFCRYCRELVETLIEESCIVEVKTESVKLGLLIENTFQDPQVLLLLKGDKTSSGVVFAYFTQGKLRVDSVVVSDTLTSLTKLESTNLLKKSIESLQLKLKSLKSRNLHSVEETVEEETFYDCGRDGCKRQFFHQHMK